MEAKDSEQQKDLEKAHFQQELNQWFESRGIISDLRSHLRRLMITALQNTQIGLKPADKTSPKAQALNLIVAEYLFRHGCHYTLSVFTSEVPSLANFSAAKPGLIKCGEKSSEVIKKHSQRHRFQEKEFEEIFNALGMTSSFEEVERLKFKYFQKDQDCSLLEVLLQIFTETSTRLQVRKALESYQVDEGRKVLPEKWSEKVVEILLSENIKSSQIAAVTRAIVRITENEVQRLIEEERKMQLQMLAEREKRIQEHLRKHEEQIFFRLVKAEKDLNERKDMIDEELTDRQKQLTKMALEWNEKHEEILKLSKNFHNIENENIRLEEKVQELERENENLRIEGECQKKTIEQLRIEISSLINKLRDVTDSNVILNEQNEVLMKKDNKEVSISDNTEEVRANAESHEWKATERVKSHLVFDDTNPKANIDLSEDDNDLSNNSFCCDGIISNVRKKLQALEEESIRINKHYLDYKLKSQNVDSDSEVSIISDKSQEKMHHTKTYEEVVKENRFCQTISPGIDVENILGAKKEEEMKGPSDSYDQNPSERSIDTSLKKPEIRTSTKRQQQNREFFLKSRQLVQEFEKQKMNEWNAGSPSVTESSFQISSSSEECENLSGGAECMERSPIPQALLTPLRTASFYCNDEPDRKELPVGEVSRKREPLNQLSKDDRDRLALLEETRIKTPQESARKLLQRQILLSEFDADDEKQKSKEDNSNKSPKSFISTPKLSVGRKIESHGA